MELDRRAIKVWLTVGLVLVVGAGCGEMNLTSSPELDATEAVEERTEAVVNRVARHPDEWFVYASCPRAEECTAELSYNGAPGAAMGTNHYAVVNGNPQLRGKDQISGVLAADRKKGCTDRYLATENVAALIPCSYGN